MQVTIGCDPGLSKPSVLAIWKDEQCIGWAKVVTEMRDSQLTEESAQKFSGYLEEWFSPGAVLAIEEPYLGKNARVYRQLSELFVELVRIGKAVGYKIIGVHPSWTVTVLRVQPNAVSSIRKIASKAIASALIEGIIDDDDIADAINIGGYQARRN